MMIVSAWRFHTTIPISSDFPSNASYSYKYEYLATIELQINIIKIEEEKKNDGKQQHERPGIPVLGVYY